MSIGNPTREQRRQLARDNLKWPKELAEVPFSEWPVAIQASRNRPDRVLRSRDFLCQEFMSGTPIPAISRLSFCRTEMTGDRWTDGITWDELQRLKREAGYGNACAVEVFPPDADVVNVANMRHLWVLVSVPAFVWGSRRGWHGG